MDRKKIYRGIVKTGIGGGAVEMSKPGSLEAFRHVAGLDIIPGTLNINLEEPFDLSLLKYVKFDDIGWEFDPATQGIKYDGEIGMYCSRVIVADKYPAFLAVFTWVRDIHTHAEIMCPFHLRSTLGLKDGDILEFRLDEHDLENS
jgi:CTP-dependent riboflavin kinase